MSKCSASSSIVQHQEGTNQLMGILILDSELFVHGKLETWENSKLSVTFVEYNTLVLWVYISASYYR